jgi:hypothetical protein
MYMVCNRKHLNQYHNSMMITFNFDLTTITVDFLSVQTGTNQTNSSQERRLSRERCLSQERRLSGGTGRDGWGKLWYPPNQGFFICRFPSIAQKCVTQKYVLYNIERKNTGMVASHLKKVRIDFFKIPGISTWPDVEFGTGTISVTLGVIVIWPLKHRQRLYAHPVVWPGFPREMRMTGFLLLQFCFKASKAKKARTSVRRASFPALSIES